MAASLTEANLADPITRHLRRDCARVFVQQTVAEALDEIRRQRPEGRIVYFYVVDAENRLMGVVPTRKLLLSALDKPIRELMVREVVAVPDSATVLDACEFFILHRFLAFPVVDDERRLVGVIDAELYTDELTEFAGREADAVFGLIGVHLSKARQASPVAAYRSRFPWLLCNIGGGIAAALLSGLFAAELQRAIALALFLPVVLALSESVGIQSVSLALTLLAGPAPSLPALAAKLRRELAIGLLLGLSSGLVVALACAVWLGQVEVMLCLLGGISGGVAASAGIGLAVPNILHLLRRDPHVAAGPIALTLADITTLLLYFSLARWLIR